MQIYDFGEGDPEYAIIGIIHGDEPCGKRAIDRVIEDGWDYEKPVRFILANERAYEEETRFVDDDLNRVYPGNKESDSHEKQLAAAILELTDGCKQIVSLHSTHSSSKVFGITPRLKEEDEELYARLPFDFLVIDEPSKGNIGGENVIDVECGLQNTEQAAENAYNFVIDFLSIVGAIDADIPKPSSVEVFELIGRVDYGDAEFTADNFNLVKEGIKYAEKDGEPIRAEKEFYPVLMSTEGYENILGYQSRHIGKITVEG